jgi:FkbM family methyltransferase
MNDDYFNISFDEDTNLLNIFNKSNKSIKIDVWLIDLKTNLTFKGFWSYYNINQFTFHDFQDIYDFQDSCGFITKIYCDNILIQEKTFKFYNFKNNNHFCVTKYNEFNYPSWKQLMIDKVIDVKLNKYDVFYDLGANIGVYTMWAKLNNVRQIYSFEPNTILVQDMKQTFKNDCNVVIFDHAISDRFEKADFVISSQSVSSSFYHPEGTKHSVQKINLEQFCNNNNLLKPSVIKCDIEGSEYDFINSISNDFLSNLRILIFEFHFVGGKNFIDLAQVIKRLLSLGFSLRLTKDTNFDNNVGCIIFEK